MKKGSILYDILGNIGVFIYLMGMVIPSSFYLFDSSDFPFVMSEFGLLLLPIALICILSIICILFSKKRYFVAFVPVALFSIFTTIWILSASGDLRLLGLGCFALNIALLASIIYRFFNNNLNTKK
ncbi:hypothetical protein [Clostridium sp. CCUG 7971]|uniref:hypothetical protein n=1 Tax=Clostridium sp. CCUG 7971 TaxID=2811414 RepID=UPI001ABA2DAC|nr:hypothetical protein [Clostridium sp. CCUG 7971]MBO3444704.1 hypothetical protein [Clostridium sp. CCUG 7971]